MVIWTLFLGTPKREPWRHWKKLSSPAPGPLRYISIFFCLLNFVFKIFSFRIALLGLVMFLRSTTSKLLLKFCIPSLPITSTTKVFHMSFFFLNNINTKISISLSPLGHKFWSGAKRPPTPFHFDVNNEAHLDFVTSAAVLRAYMFGIVSSEIKGQGEASVEARKEAVRGVVGGLGPVKDFKPKAGVKIETDENAKDAPAETCDDDEQFSFSLFFFFFFFSFLVSLFSFLFSLFSFLFSLFSFLFSLFSFLFSFSLFLFSFSLFLFLFFSFSFSLFLFFSFSLFFFSSLYSKNISLSRYIASMEGKLTSMPPPAKKSFKQLNIVDFEKDDDNNYHIDFIHAAANMRAFSHGIDTVFFSSFFLLFFFFFFSFFPFFFFSSQIIDIFFFFFFFFKG